MKKNLYVDINALQILPPACVNRDDTGMPKTVVYGGVERARVSSQAWKHAMRTYFNDNLACEIGVRTKDVYQLVADFYTGDDFSKECFLQLVTDIFSASALSPAKDDTTKVGALLFVSPDQAKAIAEMIETKAKEVCEGKKTEKEQKAAWKKWCPKAIGSGKKQKPNLTDPFMQEFYTKISTLNSPDLALFGRMVASHPALNIQGAAQVSHAIGTHGTNVEFDYFTALDDRNALSNQSGAGMLGQTAYNSSTVFRYATVDVYQLLKNLDSNTEKTTEAVHNFIEAFLLSLPTGKQNSFAAQTVPYFVYITVREDRPVSMAGAFETPVDENVECGFAAASKQQLVNHIEHGMHNMLLKKPLGEFVIQTDDENSLKSVSSADLDTVQNQVSAILEGILPKVEV
jgi:CRISPR system Cascade subunit CasC